MGKIRTFVLLGVFAALSAFISAQKAECAIVSVLGAGSFASGTGNNGFNSPSLLLGGELTAGLESLLELGGFYEHNFITQTAGGNTGLNFFGAVARVSPLNLFGLFADVKLGVDTQSGANSEVGFGFGAGMRFSVAPLITISPRVGYRNLPLGVPGGSMSRSMVDVGLMLSLGF